MRPPGDPPEDSPEKHPPGRHRRPEPFTGGHRLVVPRATSRRARASAAAVLLLAVGAAPASLADPPDPPSARPDAGLLAARQRAADDPSRSMARDGSQEQPAPEPRGAAPEQRPAPEPEPAGRPEQEQESGSKPESGSEADSGSKPDSKPESKPDSKPDSKPESKPDPKPEPVGGLNKRQMAHAATIVRIGRELGLPKRAYVVALATALQESHLRVYASPAVPKSFDFPHDAIGADHDSVGLFQQRPSMGWGSVKQCMDPEYATRTFYRALREVSGWRHMPITVAAQTVQVSAFPDHYAKHEPLARKLVDALS